MTFKNFIVKNAISGRISEIIDISEKFYKTKLSNISTDKKIEILCTVMDIEPEDLDVLISGNSEVCRTVKGHAFEAVFDYFMKSNDILYEEIGGDSDIDRKINNNTLQLKTPYVKGCKKGIVSYKTHKTHGAKSERESLSYYHNIKDFADFLVGLVSYSPFQVMIVPKSNLPRIDSSPDFIKSPMYFKLDKSEWINNFKLLGINREMRFEEKLIAPEKKERLPISSSLINLKSEFILNAIFTKENFRIWDMNLRGFMREHMLLKTLKNNGIEIYPTNITGKERHDKCDTVLRNKNNNTYDRFQVKGLTWRGTKLKGKDTVVDCETQLSRGRVNDHPTQSRLYKTTDFDYLIIAVEPPYTNIISLNSKGKNNYNWNFYCIPISEIRTHSKYPNRVSSHQYISVNKLEKYRIDFENFKTIYG